MEEGESVYDACGCIERGIASARCMEVVARCWGGCWRLGERRSETL
jgi:hypothetical protein